MAKKNSKKAALWLKAGQQAPLFYPDQFFREMVEAREELLQKLAGECDAEPLTRGRTWQLDRLRGVLRVVFPPDGRIPANLTHGAVQRHVVPVYKEMGWKEPCIDTIARVRGRRKT
ncbi:hypothetical protein IVB14_32695 [Bradyrhizobium sp. 180]|uniref:hypothetical protein n=1 Tax=Bradyrhizobium sp. 180 TaxID=2782650 RepID=UPI001FF9AE9F|nr:hypothetical protein [Bradyrhizobium sp. 180]MCK1495038.1 hypothetical protein [Bradyrhizobium sp. 180]